MECYAVLNILALSYLVAIGQANVQLGYLGIFKCTRSNTSFLKQEDMSFKKKKYGNPSITYWPKFFVPPSGALAEERLQNYLFENYNKHIRPSKEVSDVVEVSFILSLLQLISVAEKSEEMTTSQFISLRWKDSRLTWNPEEFEGIKTVRIPSKIIWRPDIALKNNIDGDYDKTLPVNAILNYSGLIEWMPPAIYKSSCSIQVEYFPFDWQNCTLSFRSFSYSPKEVRLISLYDKIVVDKEAYTDNGEWNVIHCPIRINWDEKDPDYQDVTLYLIIQRKPLFYIINIIVPCVLISSLSVLVFYLPSGCSEKMNMSISVLLGLPVYLLLLAKRVPETSLGVPLIGSYLLFTMLSVTCSVIFSVFVLNVHHRSPSTNIMKPWIRSLFIDFLSPLLYINQPINKSINLDSEFSLKPQPIQNTMETENTQEFRRLDGSEFPQSRDITTQRLDRKRKIGLFEPLHRRRREMQIDSSSGPIENFELVPRITAIHSAKHARQNIQRLTQYSPKTTYHLPTDSDSCGRRIYNGDSPDLTTFSSPQTFRVKRDVHYSERFTGLFSPAISHPRTQVTSNTSSLKTCSLEDGHHENKTADIMAAPGVGNSKNTPDDVAPAFREYFLLSCDRKREVFKTSKSSSDKEEAISGNRSITSDKEMNISSFQTKPSENIRQEQIRKSQYFHRERYRRLDQIRSYCHPIKHRRAVPTPSHHGGSRSFESLREVSSSPRKKTEPVTTVIHSLPKQANECLDAVNFICQHLRNENEYKKAVQEWHMVAMVLERLMFWIFLFIYVTGSFYFAVKALTNYPPAHPFMTGDPKYATCWADKNDHVMKSKWNF